MKPIIEDELYNDDFMHKVPSWIVRYGNTVFAFFLLFLVVFAHFFSFNTIVTTEAVVSNLEDSSSQFIGELRIPSKEVKKIKVNQKVLIKLSDFPYEEFGSLSARIVQINNDPLIENGTFFIAQAKIDSMVTNQNKKINAEYDILASADIMVEELSILQRIFYQFRDLWSSN